MMMDCFRQPVEPREWFLVSLPAINAAIERIRNGSISDYSFSARTSKMVTAESPSREE